MSKKYTWHSDEIHPGTCPCCEAEYGGEGNDVELVDGDFDQDGDSAWRKYHCKRCNTDFYNEFYLEFTSAELADYNSAEED